MKKKQAICLEKKYANFIYGKVYEAKAFATKGLGKHRRPADFKIIDEDGDYYQIAETETEINKKWKWVESE